MLGFQDVAAGDVHVARCTIPPGQNSAALRALRGRGLTSMAHANLSPGCVATPPTVGDVREVLVGSEQHTRRIPGFLLPLRGRGK
jgi:hypothetical protein